MKFQISKEWLESKLSIEEDVDAAAGGSSLADLKKEISVRMVTPAALVQAPTKLAKVVRYIREQRGWTQEHLAQISTLEESEIQSLETDENYKPSPRAIVYLSDALGLSKDRLKQLVGFIVDKKIPNSNNQMAGVLFAANSDRLNSVSEDEFEAVRALVEVLTEKQN